jgi:hypothetical protein
MIRSRRLSRFLPSLVAGTVAGLMLAEVLAQWQYVDAPVATPLARAASGAAAVPASKTMAAINLDPAEEAIVLQRPLFSPTRRPPPPPPPPSSATAAGGGAATKPSVPEPPPMNFTLVGIVRDQTSSLALLQPTNGKRVMSLRAGQALDGWMLVSIGIDTASFRNGAAVRELALDFRRAAPPLPPPAPQQ